MANPEHVRRLLDGASRWNQWRADYSDTSDFNGADLRDGQLSGADFSNAKLEKAIFARAKLEKANFFGAHLHFAAFDTACTGIIRVWILVPHPVFEAEFSG